MAQLRRLALLPHDGPWLNSIGMALILKNGVAYGMNNCMDGTR